MYAFAPLGNPKVGWRFAHQKVFSRAFIDKLREQIDETSWQSAKVGSANKLNPSIRLSLQQPMPLQQDYLGEIARHIHLANEAIWRFALTGFDLENDPPNFVSYPVGAHYDWHLDFGLSFTTRKLSFVMPLADPSTYEGGDFEMFPPFAEEKREEVKQLGNLILFPSYVPHRILPVTNGRRLSLVGWAHGPSFR